MVLYRQNAKNKVETRRIFSSGGAMGRRCVLLIAVVMSVVCGTAHGAFVDQVVLCCQSNNDLYTLLVGQGITPQRCENPADAVNNAPNGGAVLILADGYPGATTTVGPSVFTAAADKNIKLYVEFPAQLPEMTVGSVRTATLERGVVTSEIFQPALNPNDLIIMHRCRFVDVAADNSYIVIAKVAGFDTAVFGLTDTTAYPILFKHPARDILVCTTKLSQFVTGRYAPQAGLQAIWKVILEWLCPGQSVPTLGWQMTVRPTYGPDEPLDPNAQRDAIIRGINWHTNGKLLIHESWLSEYAAHAHRVGPWPDPSWSAGDGEYGLLEGVYSRIAYDGTQNVNWWLRTDVNGESALAFALRSSIDGDTRSATIARNLLDWVYFNSGLLHLNDPNDGNYGILGWAPDATGTYFHDNDIKAILGCIGSAGVLNTNRWNDVLVRNILGNFRTTGQRGFRGHALSEPSVTNNGWQYYWRRDFVHCHPHYEAWIWASYLWLYHKTGYAPLLERTRQAISLMMQSYPDNWQWTNGFQQERGRMLLVLAWLIRVDDRPEHRAWLSRIAEDMLEDQVLCGAIREELGPPGLGNCDPPQSNTEYGSSEASLIQENGDPLADMLYTCNFAFLGLHEAYAATGDPKYKQMEDKLAEFFVRIQIRSQAHPRLDGAWYRAFDYELWDYWGSNADPGWGAWCVECGWTQGWIVTTLGLRELGLNLWDMSADSTVADIFGPIRREMMPDDQLIIPGAEFVEHDAIGKSIELMNPSHSRYPGLGSGGLVDGSVYPAAFAEWPWMGWWGNDLQATIDLGEILTINNLAAHFLQDIQVGIFMPTRAVFSVSDDGVAFTEVATVKPRTAERESAPTVEIFIANHLSRPARYVRVHAHNVGTIPSWHPQAGINAWLFADEIMVNMDANPFMSGLYHVPTDASLGLTWTQVDFDDFEWQNGPMPIGYEKCSEDGLAGYWNFDGNTEDQSGQGNHGQVFGPVYSDDAPPQIGQGQILWFDGVDDYVLVPDALELRIGSEFALSLWIKSGDINQTQKYLLSRHSGSIQQAVIYRLSYMNM